MDPKKSSTNISVLHTFDTIYCADSIEWCPHEPFQHLFVCGNYQLKDTNKETGQCERFGKIRLFSINNQELTQHQVIDTDAILDQKWCHNQIGGFSVLSVANAKNKLELYRLNPDLQRLELITFLEGDNTNILLLSLDWSTGKFPSEEPAIVASDSTGSIKLFDLKDCKLTERICWNAHSFEAWICAFDYWDTSVIFTGGDDGKLLKFDIRVGTEPLLKLKSHSAGVTALHSNKDKEFILASGSYDSNLLLWDTRHMKTFLSSREMPGCLWRLKWSPHDYNNILAACMRGGFHIVDATNVHDPKIIVNYYEHEDLAYGADWSYLKDYNNQNSFVIGACSFYDHKLSVASVDL